MAADQSQIEAALNAVEDPELGLTLGDLGLLRTVRPRRRRVLVEVALPVAAWPGTEELAEEIHRAALGVPGVEEVELEFVVMTDEERTGLRHRLRAGMLGEGDGARRRRAPASMGTATPATATRPPRRCRPSSVPTPRPASSVCPRGRAAWGSRRSR